MARDTKTAPTVTRTKFAPKLAAKFAPWFDFIPKAAQRLQSGPVAAGSQTRKAVGQRHQSQSTVTPEGGGR